MQLEATRLLQQHAGGRRLIVTPLGVRQEFAADAAKKGRMFTNVLGENHPCAILDEAKVSFLREHGKDLDFDELAKEWGVSKHTIQNIWWGKTWKNVMPDRYVKYRESLAVVEGR